jgi:ATP synthase protein I
MVRPTSGGCRATLRVHACGLIAMANDGSHKRPGSDPQASEDAELSERLKRLGTRLDQVRDAAPQRRGPDGTSPSSEPSPMGKAFRLSSEFMAGIIAGAGLGWGMDKLLGTRPWGMIVLTMLGFGAGIWNVMRASGFVRPPRG